MSDKFILNIDVQSNITGDVCVFQELPDTNASKVLTLAWLTKRVHHNTQLVFDWTLDFNFNWGKTGYIGSDRRAHFQASQVIPANLSTQNQISFNYENGAYQFKDPGQNSNSENNLYILQGPNVRSEDVLVGVGMAGAGSFVVGSQPNLKLIFHPKPVYYVVFGDFIQGEVMDITELTNTHKVVFDGTNEQSLVLTGKNTWVGA